MGRLDLTTWHVATPLEVRATTAIHDITEVHSVLVELRDGEHVGHGYASAFTPGQARALRALVLDLEDLYTAAAAEAPAQVHAAAMQRMNFVGRTGIVSFAISILDTALWDLQAQRRGLSMVELLGSRRDWVPVYATGGWLSTATADLVDEAVALVEAGYGGVKIKVGSSEWRDDVKRLERVREALGKEPALLADANQAWDVSAAVEVGRSVADLDLTWLEEPVDANDVGGTASVRRDVPVRIAAGETRFGVGELTGLLEHGAVDVLMPDLAHVGGITPLLEVAAAASAAGVEMSLHTFTEVSLPLVAAAGSGSWVEHVPGWWDCLFEEPAGPPVDGALPVPSTPGLGIAFSDRVKHDYAV